MRLVRERRRAENGPAMNSFAVGKITPLLVGFTGLFLALVLGLYIGSSDYRPILLGVPAAVGLFLWFGTGQWFWPITLASSYLGGTFPILGGSFTPFQILIAIGVGKFMVEDVVMRRVSFPKMDRSLLLALAGFMIIMTGHGVLDRFGMRFLGSHVWGGRNYVNVYVGLIAFFVVQTVRVDPRIWNKLPYLALAVTSFDVAIATVTTIFPALIYKIYPFYSAVGPAGISELLTGHESLGERIGAFGNFGYILIAIILASVPIWRLLTPGNLRRMFLSVLAAVSVVSSGFRSSIANFVFTLFVAGYRDLRLGVLTVVPILAAILFALSAINSAVIPLPKQMQRALVFLPGNWDADMVRDASASNDFRAQVWTLWWKDVFPKQPLVGRGFGFKSSWADPTLNRPGAPDYYQQMVEVGNIHNGLFASLDAVGIIGTLFFVAWNVILLRRTVHVSFDRENPAGFALRFVALQLAVPILAFWLGAVTLGTFLPGQFAMAGLFLRLQRLSVPKPASPITPSQPPLSQRRRTVAPV
ncbi:MAG: hypothetical protein H0V54_03170 [Chthoniobacterales bacterium]|nr:hypothetical protein [Chthoniobacterales bacterium]